MTMWLDIPMYQLLNAWLLVTDSFRLTDVPEGVSEVSKKKPTHSPPLSAPLMEPPAGLPSLPEVKFTDEEEGGWSLYLRALAAKHGEPQPDEEKGPRAGE